MLPFCASPVRRLYIIASGVWQIRRKSIKVLRRSLLTHVSQYCVCLTVYLNANQLVNVVSLQTPLYTLGVIVPIFGQIKVGRDTRHLLHIRRPTTGESALGRTTVNGLHTVERTNVQRMLVYITRQYLSCFSPPDHGIAGHLAQATKRYP